MNRLLLRPRRTGSASSPFALLLATGLMVAGLLAPPGLHAQTAEGCWVGVFGDGPGRLRGILELRTVDGALGGSIHRLGPEIDTDPLTTVELRGDSLVAAFPSTLGTGLATFQGTISGEALQGTIRSGGQALPAQLARVRPDLPDPALDLLGYWTGGLFQGNALALRLGFRIAPAPCGRVHLTMDSPDQGAIGIPSTGVTLEGSGLTVEFASLQAGLRAEIGAPGDSLTGSWSQGPAVLPLRLARSESDGFAARPQEPVPPFPYRVEEVAYRNVEADLGLTGTLTLPEGEGPFPAALLITGSGAQDRDETIMGHRPFLVIADHLTRAGIAVLRVDDRGVGGSEGSTMDATILDFASDVRAGLAFLAARPEIDPTRIGLIGHSEGGFVGPAVAAGSDAVAFVVTLAGPAVTGRQILLSQLRAVQTAAGVPEAVTERDVALQTRLLDLILAEPDDARAREGLLRELEASVADFTPAQRREFEARNGGADALRAAWAQQAGTMVSPWYRALLAFDPIPYLEALEMPVLALFGERDLQVPPEESAPILIRIWADHPDATVLVLPELNHLFQHAETGLMAEYAAIEETFAPVALETLSEWIVARFGG